MLEPLTRATLPDQASRALKRFILERQLMPGDQLPSERYLTELLGVSRTVVREALQMLVAEGLLVKEASRGAYVRKFDVRQLEAQLADEVRAPVQTRSLLEVRAALEIGALAFVTQRISPEELARLEGTVAAMRGRFDAGQPIGDLDQEFHALLLEAIHNPTFAYVQRWVLDAIRSSDQRKTVAYVRPADRNTVETAERIVAALHKHDPDGAQRAMRAHLLIERPAEQARLVLFFDREEIAETHGLAPRLASAHKFPHNPVLSAEHPWEGVSVMPSATMLYDAERMLYRLWYHGSRLLSPREELLSLCYASSADGIHWVKPPLNIAPFPDARDNNLVIPWGDPSHGDVVSATILPMGGAEDEQYSMVYLASGGPLSGVCLARSPDGLHWTPAPENPVDAGGAAPVGDALYCLADVETDRFIAYYRLPRRVATQPTVGRMESHDLRHWTGHRPILSTDAEDPADAELHGLTPFRYGRLMLGLLWIHRRERGGGELQLAASRDGVQWTRLGARHALLSSGPAGAFDEHGMVQATAPVVVGNELWFYYAGARQPSNGGAPVYQIGLATLTLDRFMALEAGAEEGSATTVPIDCTAQPQLLLNAVVNPRGYVLVEVLREDGSPIPGFTREEAIPFDDNAVYHQVSWREHANLEALAGQSVRLRFIACRAALYAFRLAHPHASVSDLLAGIC